MAGEPHPRTPPRGPAETLPRVAWGLGTGRHLRHAARAGEHLIVFAVDLSEGEAEGRITQVLAQRPELAEAQRQGRLEFVIGDLPTLRERFAALTRAADGFLLDSAALAAAPERLRPLVRLIERLHIERRDADRFRDRLRRNLECNRQAIAAAAPLTAIAKHAHGRPAFVLAAGPSAAAATRWLPELRRYGPLIAVDTALPLCRAAETTVDVVATMDPHASSQRHLRAGVADVELLAFQPYSCPEVVAAFPLRLLAVPAGDRLCERLADALDLPRVEASGTVLTYALDVALTLGCDPIVLIGADFAHVGGQSHAAGTASAVTIDDTGLVTETVDGHKVATSHMLERFRAAVEQRIAGASNRRFWTIDGGGARIVGAQVVSWVALAQWLSELHPRDVENDSRQPVSSHVSEPELRLDLINNVLKEFDSR